MDSEEVLDSAYETQHFGFHPRVFFDEIYNVYFENLFAMCEQFQKYLCTVFEKDEMVNLETVKLNTDALFKDIVKQLDKAIDKFEVYTDRNIFCIEDNVMLPEDEVHKTHPCTEEDEQAFNQEIEILMQQIIKEKVRKSVIKAKLDEQEFVKEKLIYFQQKMQELLTAINQCEMTKEAICTVTEKCCEAKDIIKNHQEKIKLVEGPVL